MFASGFGLGVLVAIIRWLPVGRSPVHLKCTACDYIWIAVCVEISMYLLCVSQL